MKLLQDVGKSRCLLTESVSTDTKIPEGVLGVVEGICSDFSQATRNNNFYSRRLWENVLNSDYIKECLETRTLFGALDHPENLDNLAGDAAVSCTKLWIDDSDNCLKGSFNVLPTPRGNILDALLKTGSKLGVSCRGVGDLTEDMASGNQIVNEDTYTFVCFDVVTQPAAIKARQTYSALTESKKLEVKPVLDALVESVGKCKSIEELTSVTKLAEHLGYHTAKEFKEKTLKQTQSINDNSEAKLLKENKELSALNARLTKDLETAYAKCSTLEDAKSRSTVAADLANIRIQLDKLNESVSANTVEEIVKQIEPFTPTELDRKISNVKSKYEARLKEANEVIKDLTAKIEFSKDFAKKCKKVIEESESKNDKLLKTNTMLKDNLDNFKLSTKNNIIKLKEDNNILQTRIADLTAEVKKQKTLREKVLREYTEQQSINFGVPADSVKLTEGVTLKDIDLMLAKSNRTRNLRPNPKLKEMTAPKVLDSDADGTSCLSQVFDIFNNR